jgi:tripartite motif-containing protein 45
MILTRKIKEFTSRSDFEINKITCHLCAGELLATCHCLTCGSNLCSFCKEAHKRQTLTSNHEIKVLNDKKSKRSKSAERISDTSRTIKCSIHPQDLKLFCIVCHQVICPDCTILLHRGHKIISVQKASKIYIKVIKDELQKTRPMATYAIHSISKLFDLSKKINAKCLSVESEVESFLADYFQALEVHKKTLLNQISRARETKLDMVKRQQLDLEKRSNEAKTVISFTEELLNEGNDLETLIFVNSLLKKFQHCRKNDNSMDIKVRNPFQIFLKCFKI